MLGRLPRRRLRCDHARSRAGSARRRHHVDPGPGRRCPPTWARPEVTTTPAVLRPRALLNSAEAVWTGNAPEAARGFLALGTPIGHPAHVASHTDARLREEARLLQELPLLPDLQCAWLILAMCAAPHADHLLRTLLPDLSASYARGHDDAVWQCLRDLLGEPDDRDPESSLPPDPSRFCRPASGGLGLQCAERVPPAAYWAAWADGLPVVRLRRPDAAARCLAELDAGLASFALCLRAAVAAGAHLTHAGWEGRPEWRTIHDACGRPNATCLNLASGARAICATRSFLEAPPGGIHYDLVGSYERRECIPAGGLPGSGFWQCSRCLETNMETSLL